MFGKAPLQVVALAVLVVLSAAPICRGDDSEDCLLARVRKRQADEGRELERDVTAALAGVKSLAPEKARNLLQASRARLLDDRHLPAAARNRLLRQVEDRLDSVREKVARKSPRVVEVAGAAGVQVTPVVSADRRFVRVGLSGTFVAPSGLPAVSLSTTVSVPDRGTAVVGGYSSLAEGRHEYGPPGLGNVSYASPPVPQQRLRAAGAEYPRAPGVCGSSACPSRMSACSGRATRGDWSGARRISRQKPCAFGGAGWVEWAGAAPLTNVGQMGVWGVSFHLISRCGPMKRIT